MARHGILTADFHDAVSAALRCWDVDAVETLPWVQMAAMTGVSQIAYLFSRHIPASDETASGDASPSAEHFSAGMSTPSDSPQQQEAAYLASVVVAISTEAKIPGPQAAAFLVRLFVDALATPAYQAAFLKLPIPIANAIANEWMQLAVAAWHVGWYPGLDGPAQAAAELSAGWPWLLLMAAATGDVYTRWAVSVASGYSAEPPRYLDFAPPTPETALPKRARRAASYSDTRMISDTGAFQHALGGLLESTKLSELTRTVILEVCGWLALQDMTTGILPEAVRMNIGLASGDNMVSIFGADAEASWRATQVLESLCVELDTPGAARPDFGALSRAAYDEAEESVHHDIRFDGAGGDAAEGDARGIAIDIDGGTTDARRLAASSRTLVQEDAPHEISGPVVAAPVGARSLDGINGRRVSFHPVRPTPRSQQPRPTPSFMTQTSVPGMDDL